VLAGDCGKVSLLVDRRVLVLDGAAAGACAIAGASGGRCECKGGIEKHGLMVMVVMVMVAWYNRVLAR